MNSYLNSNCPTWRLAYAHKYLSNHHWSLDTDRPNNLYDSKLNNEMYSTRCIMYYGQQMALVFQG